MADARTDVGRGSATSSLVIHWSAVLAGSFVALGTWMFLLALGAAIQGEDGPNTWTAVYNLVAPIVALFVGGAVAARSRAVGTRFDGLMHGAVIWGFTLSVGALLIGMFGDLFMDVSRPGQSAAPRGFAWAIAGSILFSLLAALLGTSSVRERRALVGGEAYLLERARPGSGRYERDLHGSDPYEPDMHRPDPPRHEHEHRGHGHDPDHDQDPRRD